MAAAFAEAHRVLKPGAPLVCIYAHKTTLGWATLVDALRTAGFTITEAWPLDTEMPERSVGQGTRKPRVVDLPGGAQARRSTQVWAASQTLWPNSTRSSQSGSIGSSSLA